MVFLLFILSPRELRRVSRGCGRGGPDLPGSGCSEEELSSSCLCWEGRQTRAGCSGGFNRLRELLGHGGLGTGLKESQTSLYSRLCKSLQAVHLIFEFFCPIAALFFLFFFSFLSYQEVNFYLLTSNVGLV